MTKLHYAILEQKPQPQARLRPFVLLIGLGVLAATICIASLAFAADCVPNPAAGICCKPVPCGGPDGFVNYETKRPVDGSLCGTDTAAGLVCEDTLTLRRLGLPTNAADPNHYAVWETTDGPSLDGMPFAAKTALGDVEGRAYKFRFFITQDTAKSFVAQPPPVSLTKLWDCYGVDNVKVTAGGVPIGRQAVSWVDQISPHDATVAQPALLCLPGNGATTETFICFGTMRGYGSVPADKKFPFVSVPAAASPADNGLLGQVEIKPPHEFCTVVLP